MDKSVEKANKTKKTQSAADPVYLALRQEILSGQPAAGTPLRQDDIAQKHGISKIPVREALRRLETDGLVEFRPRRGAIVRSIPDTEVLELIDVRLALECRALEMAIPQMIESDLRIAEQIHREYTSAVQRERWSELNLQFHRCILEPCGNNYLLSLISDIEQRMGALTRLKVTQVSGLDRPLREHETILMACRAGDVDQGVAALRSHIETTKKEFSAFLRRK